MGKLDAWTAVKVNKADHAMNGRAGRVLVDPAQHLGDGELLVEFDRIGNEQTAPRVVVLQADLQQLG